mgnify:CR=1 FL=1
MSSGPIQVFSGGGAIASGASTGTYIDLGGKSFTKMSVLFPSMSTGAALTLRGAATAAGTYGTVFQLVPSTSTVAYQALTVATTTSGGWATFDAPPFQFIKFVASDVVSGGVAGFTIAVQD